MAEGTKLKAGLTRRIAVSMTELDFFAFRDLAVKEGRSLSDVIIRYAKVGTVMVSNGHHQDEAT